MKKFLPPFFIFLFLFYRASPQNVGIGITNPLYPADIADSVSGTVLRLRTISNTIGDRTLLRMTTSTSNSLNALNSSYIGNQRQATGSALVFGTASSLSLAPAERMRLNEDGFLGIGTDNPLARLHIDMSNVNTTSIAMIINDDDDPIVYFQRNNINGGFLQYLGNDFKIGTPVNNDLGSFIIRTNGTDRFFVNNIGNVGLGISTPQSRLHVQGDAIISKDDALLLLQNTAGVNKGIFYLSNDDVRVGTSATNDNGRFQIRTNNVDRITCTGLGFTGIGTTTPTNFLTIDATGTLDNTPVVINTFGTRDIQFQRSAFPSSYMRFSQNNLHIGTYASNSTGYLYFGTREIEHMWIDNIGRISMGVISPNIPGYRLSVRGEIICEDITLLPFAMWPDYVFEKNYVLRPLSEVESYIKTHKHLPGISSSAEVARDGIKLAETQKKIMEKIEELTLYIIELNKKNEILQREIELLKKK